MEGNVPADGVRSGALQEDAFGFPEDVLSIVTVAEADGRWGVVVVPDENIARGELLKVLTTVRRQDHLGHVVQPLLDVYHRLNLTR